MKKTFNICYLLFVICAASGANAAVRDANSTVRVKTTVPEQTSKTTRVAAPRQAVTPRAATGTTTSTREGVNRDTSASRATTTRGAATASRGTTTAARSVAPQKTTVARAAIDSTDLSDTRTGAAYETCKAAYFTCMDQFCKLKNDDYRRCSCSDRVYDLTDVKTVMQDANSKLTEFTESLDAVGMTKNQATAMRTASEGENALTSDSSASKALLQAIMNSIRGEDASVGGKFSALNSINLSFDTANAFGMTDAGQVIAAYNGTNLYTAVYPSCRNAVRADCTDAALQRAVTAYLMAVEQDCNTVQTMINETKKKMTAAVRESSAMLDLARIENRQKHNSDDMTACIANVEAAILSEEVCGAGYHKCLDNGEFIDISTGAPIIGVVRFYELEHLLTFNEAASTAEQKLSKVANNRIFVKNFEKRVKKFAEPALDKCTEKADLVWEDYLDKAMLDIFYAQKAKVAEIKRGCFDFVSACYVNGDNALTAAMTEVMGDAAVVLQPDRISLNSAVCREYVSSCDNMFDGNIVKQYISERETNDTLTACRAVVKQCFDKFGGASYENFYYPYSGLFSSSHAPDWFTLCANSDCSKYKSPCAIQLSEISSCSSKDMMEKAFGGFDLVPVNDERIYSPTGTKKEYGLVKGSGLDTELDYRGLRPTGVATEVYYQIIDILKTQCLNLQGRFVELQFVKEDMYKKDDICAANFRNISAGQYINLADLYGVGDGENMCPRNYGNTVDIKSWGVCNCWENGARRSKWGKSVKCVAEMPVDTEMNDANCDATAVLEESTDETPAQNWCTQSLVSKKNQVCPLNTTGVPEPDGACKWSSPDYTNEVTKIPVGIL